MSATSRGCVFFYGHNKGDHACFSQFYPSEFEDENGEQYTCAEQFMMASKARCMGDTATLKAIMESGYDPATIKALGRRVTPWDEERWTTVRESVVARGSFLKFSQSKRLRKTLLSTGDLTLVEAAPSDRIWGIGRSVKDAAQGAKWQGLNLLGYALMKARAALDEGVELPAPVFEASGEVAGPSGGSAHALEPRPVKKQRSGDGLGGAGSEPAAQPFSSPQREPVQ